MFDDLIGTPFKDGGRDNNGFDCIGLAIEIFKRLGQTIPDYNIPAFNCSQINAVIAREAISSWQKIPQPQTPCLIVIKNHPRYVNHVGVYIGCGKFIHVMDKINVCFDRIDSPAWKNKIRGYYRYAG